MLRALVVPVVVPVLAVVGELDLFYLYKAWEKAEAVMMVLLYFRHISHYLAKALQYSPLVIHQSDLSRNLKRAKDLAVCGQAGEAYSMK